MITAGIDVGSISTKAAIVKDHVVLATKVIQTGYNAQNAGRKVFDEIQAETGISSSQIQAVVATGYGRKI